MFKHLFLKEAFVSTMLVLAVTYLISFIPFSQEYGKALHQGFADFDIYDLYYSRKDTVDTIANNNIVLVEIGAERSEIAHQVNSISKYHPKVIAIDATFDRPGDSIGDLAFSEEMNKHDNIIFANSFDEKKQLRPNFFCNENCNLSGYIDFLDKDKGLYPVVRTYSPFTTINGKQYEAFTSAIAGKANVEKYNKLKERHNNVELINYTGNLNNFLKITRQELYTLDSQQLETLVGNKIVMVGFFVKETPLVLEDLLYTPLNEQVSGKSWPDMYGVVVHANILSMILQGNYATLVSKKISYIFAFLITFLFNLYFISRFHKKTHPAHSVFMLIQFLGILLILYLFLMVFTWSKYKVPLEPVIISMVLSLELLGLYKSISLWLHKKYHYQTVFTHKHII